MTTFQRIVIEVIPHSQQRYDTAGDWQFGSHTQEGRFVPYDHGRSLRIRISDTGNDEANAALALHELAEAALCRNRGITTTTVDTFDLAFEGKGEPGDHPESPYRREHRTATNVERSFIKGSDLLFWTTYDRLVSAAVSVKKVNDVEE